MGRICRGRVKWADEARQHTWGGFPTTPSSSRGDIDGRRRRGGTRGSRLMVGGGSFTRLQRPESKLMDGGASDEPRSKGGAPIIRVGLAEAIFAGCWSPQGIYESPGDICE